MATLPEDLPALVVAELPLLSGPAKKVLAPDAPVPLRAMAARGVLPGLKPPDMVSVIAVLRGDPEASVAASATATFAALPPPILNGALGGPLAPQIVDALAREYLGRDDVLEKLVLLPTFHAQTAMYVAAHGDERATELISVNEERLLAHPQIIEKLYLNPKARVSTTDRLIELAVRNGLDLKGLPVFQEAVDAIVDELIAESTEEPTEDDLLFVSAAKTAEQIEKELDVLTEDTHEVTPEGVEVAKKKVLPLATLLEKLSKGARVRRAAIGSAAERMILVRDGNRMVATAVLKNPNIQENEILMICRSKEMSTDVLRGVGMRGEWTRSHDVKLLLVTNPKTPLTTSSKFIPHLRESELKDISRSKTVPGAVAAAARNHLSRKAKK